MINHSSTNNIINSIHFLPMVKTLMPFHPTYHKWPESHQRMSMVRLVFRLFSPSSLSSKIEFTSTGRSTSNPDTHARSSFYYSPALSTASMWAFGAAGGSSVSSSSSAKAYSTTLAPQSSFAYPPTPPIDMKLDPASASSNDNSYNHQQQQPQQQQHLQSLNQTSGEVILPPSSSPASQGPLPGIGSLEKHADPLMSSLGFAAAAAYGAGGTMGRKLPEGMTASPSTSSISLSNNSSNNSIVTTSESAPSYSYFAAPNSSELSSPLYGSYSTTGVFSAKNLQPSRPRSKSRTNAGNPLGNSASSALHTHSNFLPQLLSWALSTILSIVPQHWLH